MKNNPAIPICYSWDEFIERFPDEPIDFEMIDPCSIPEDVLDDFRAWIAPVWQATIVTTNGTVIEHDATARAAPRTRE